MVSISELMSFCKRKGIVYPTSELYGGISGFFDYGPIGVEMINNIKQLWWKEVVHKNTNIVGIDGSIITNPKVWEASGHTEKFIDFLVECKKCKAKYRADHLLEDAGVKIDSFSVENLNKLIKENNIRCPKCKGELGEVREFNLMFKTNVGPGEGEVTYLRPETAQLIYLNFKNVVETSRQKIPFGIAQIGKAFRNEISPRNFLFRMREFEQMEMQFFVKEEDADKFFEIWKDNRLEWYEKLGIKKENLRIREHEKSELAHYAKRAVDIEYKFDFGWKEIEGIHNRGNWDLSRHQKYSGKDLRYFDEETKERFIPWVIETSAGLDRVFLAVIADAYNVEEVNGDKRVVLKLSPKIAAYKAAVFPLVNKDGIPEKAKEVFKLLREHNVISFYDEKGSIGRRYRRMDEIGTPFCITIDHQTLEDNTVTIRDRDSMEQRRVKIDNLVDELYKSLNLYS
jgi:glycyl-tRNA synthetase